MSHLRAPHCTQKPATALLVGAKLCDSPEPYTQWEIRVADCCSEPITVTEVLCAHCMYFLPAHDVRPKTR